MYFFHHMYIIFILYSLYILHIGGCQNPRFSLDLQAVSLPSLWPSHGSSTVSGIPGSSWKSCFFCLKF